MEVMEDQHRGSIREDSEDLVSEQHLEILPVNLYNLGALPTHLLSNRP